MPSCNSMNLNSEALLVEDGVELEVFEWSVGIVSEASGEEGVVVVSEPAVFAGGASPPVGYGV